MITTENPILKAASAWRRAVEAAWSADEQIAMSDNPSGKRIRAARELFEKADALWKELEQLILKETP